MTPSYVDVHVISQSHKHIAFVYFGVSKTSRVKLYVREHREFYWLSRKDLRSPRFQLTRSIRFYCEKALQHAAI